MFRRGSALSLLLVAAACGGGSRPSTTIGSTTTPGDPCEAGVRGGGPPPTDAATWDEVRTLVPDGLDCASCGATAPVSVAAEAGAIVTYDGAGYHVVRELWMSSSQAPQVTIAELGPLSHVHASYEELGREEACLDGEDEDTTDCGTATVLVASFEVDVVIERSTGAVLWQATCSVDGDGGRAITPTRVTAERDRFTYTPCDGGAAVTFSTAALAACPAP